MKRISFLILITFILSFQFVPKGISQEILGDNPKDSSNYTLADTVLATTLFLEGIDLFKATKYVQALNKFDSSRVVFTHTLGTVNTNVLECNRYIGFIANGIGKLDQSINAWKAALDNALILYSEKEEELAIFNFNLGGATGQKGDLEESIYYYSEALRRFKKVHPEEEDPKVAATYLGLGTSFYNNKNYKESLFYLRKAVSLLEKAGTDKLNLAKVYGNLGAIQHILGYYRESISYLESARQIYIDLGYENTVEIARTYLNMGNAYSFYGNYFKAKNFHEKALFILKKLRGEKHPEVAALYQSLAVTYYQIHKQSKAISYNNEAIAILTPYKNEFPLEIANLLQNLGLCYIQQGKEEQAIENFKKAEKYYLDFGTIDSVALAKLYSNLGTAYQSNRAYDLAIEYFQKALSVIDNMSFIEGGYFASTQASLGLLFYETGNFQKAEESFERALLTFGLSHIDSLTEINALPKLAETLFTTAQFYRRWYDQSSSIDHLRKARHFNQLVFKVVQLKLKNSLTESKKILAEAGAKMSEMALNLDLKLYQQTDSLHYLEDAFVVVERSRSLLLYQALQESQALNFAGIPDSLLQREYELKIDLTYYDKLRQGKLNEDVSETDTTLLNISSRLFELNQTYDRLKHHFEKSYPEYYRLKYDLNTASLEEVQKGLLQPDQALLEYFVGDSTVFIFLVQPERYEVVKVEMDSVFKQQVRQLQWSLQKPLPYTLEYYNEAARYLYEKLIAPLADRLPERLVIVPDGILNYVPYETLLTHEPESIYQPERYPYLLNRHQISYNYSATLLREMVEKLHQQKPQNKVLGFAPYSDVDTVFTNDLDQSQWWLDDTRADTLVNLPQTKIELDSLKILFPTDGFYGKAATKAEFWKLAAQYRVIHLATHGKADTRLGDYSYLAFAPFPDSLDNELLYVRDLYNLKLNADLVVLSACETGTGELQRGEGLVSLARAFAYAGAKSITTTLWQVDDRSTQELMTHYYRYLKSETSKDEALRRAKIDFLASRKDIKAHPSLWAGIIAVGDMHPLK
ncbi:CHAT domain-containing protein [Flavilitoribacter nigricans]|uniref:CHAT domain-containing protein n=1 Tax=Flavilitoribacter nigricans (strain ATCC 23147 / DSM 23189 / NBRC 102662 / NCIMB 1420 / SS-2) TaxID=1122177 RepID=A0A2D0N197_FLAN2|nr:CHAT domain-containing protein [Flavilitoribacter nigricans]PHN02237.1 hypothetical protein CRP01_33425 [Flavilitoribacter nigricans DSM 23189 = NBRC 102662]